MAKAAPAFQFYAEKFLAGTSAMSAAARGCYISMLASSWSIGPIADTPRSIAAAMCLTPFDPPFADLWAEIQPKWQLGAAGWTNAKLEDVRAEQERYRAIQSEKGKKGGRPKAAEKPEVNPEVMPQVSQPKAEPKAGAKPDESPVDFDLQPLNLELSTSPLPESEESTLSEPAHIAAILAIAPFDRTPDQSETLHAYRGGPALLPRGSRPQRTRTGVDPNVNSHRGCYGHGTLPSCNRGVCVTSIHSGPWLAQMQSDPACVDPDAYVRQFIADTVRSLPPGGIGENRLKFWDKAWERYHGQSIKLQSSYETKGERVLSEAQRAVALIEARQASGESGW